MIGTLGVHVLIVTDFVSSECWLGWVHVSCLVRICAEKEQNVQRRDFETRIENLIADSTAKLSALSGNAEVAAQHVQQALGENMTLRTRCQVRVSAAAGKRPIARQVIV